MTHSALAAASFFTTPGKPLRALAIGEGAGRIHHSFRVECEGGAVVLQRLNEAVFPDLNAVMGNFTRVTDHLRRKRGSNSDRAVLRALPTHLGQWLHRDPAGSAWRCTRFIEHSRMPSEPPSTQDAWAVAFMLGRFLGDLSDLPLESLEEVLPGFHDTRARFDAFCDALSKDPRGRAGQATAEIALARDHSALASPFTNSAIPLRPVHNDTKLANVLLDGKTGQGLCVLDLDTVMPGFAAHDFGDLVRSAAFDGGEESEAPLNLERLSVLAEGYFEGAGNSLSLQERSSFSLGAQIISFELGLRFLTDFLQGDPYFGASHPQQNLLRARAQFYRVLELERHAAQVASLLNPK